MFHTPGGDGDDVPIGSSIEKWAFGEPNGISGGIGGHSVDDGMPFGLLVTCFCNDSLL